MAIKTECLRLRYLVPFEYGDDYDKAINSLRSTFFKDEWKPVKEPMNVKLFKNIDNLFSETETSIGTELERDKSLPQFTCCDEKYKVCISAIGVYCLKNNMGFLWYELGIDEKLMANSEDLFNFQNAVAQLSYIKKTWGLFEKSGEDTPRIFFIGRYINQILSPLTDVHFFPGNVRTFNDGTFELPDRALICNYAFLSADTDKERNDFIFRLTNGYNSSYLTCTDLEERCIRPFENVWWYATQSGCGQYAFVSDNKATNAFFSQYASQRMTTHFYLYVIAAIQYYSLLKQSDEIAQINTDIKSGMKKTSYKQLKDCVYRMNVFSMKYSFPQVSHITHQNDFYKYLLEVYNVHSMYGDTKEGLDAVDEMLEKYHEARSDSRMFLCTIIGAIFVIMESFGNISNIISDVFHFLPYSVPWLLATTLSMLGIVALSLIIWLVWKKIRSI